MVPAPFMLRNGAGAMTASLAPALSQGEMGTWRA